MLLFYFTKCILKTNSKLKICLFCFSHRYQLTVEDLKKQNEDLDSQYSALAKTKKEKIQRLKEQIASQEERVEDLCNKLEEVKQTRKERETLLQEQQLRNKQLLEQMEKRRTKHTEQGE